MFVAVRYCSTLYSYKLSYIYGSPLKKIYLF